VTPSSGATFSADGIWRYRLWRRWSEAPPVCLVGLNPSTADGHRDDPTIRRCVRFAQRWGHGGIEMVNLYAFCATDPAGLWAEPEARRRGPGWASAFWAAVRRSDRVVACWGGFNRTSASQRRDAERRAAVVTGRFQARGIGLWHLGLTATGQPRHPLYLPGDRDPQTWISASTASAQSPE
jgi:hypothetical protein